MTDKERDRIECAIRHIQTAVDVDPWAMEIAVEAMKEKISREPRSFSCGQEDDPISRKEAIDALCSVCGVDCDKSKFVYGGKQEDQVILCPEHYALTQLPSAQPEHRWIPVTERLPKVDEEVLATTVWNNVTIALRIGVDKWFIHDGATNATTEDLVAWMPLPKPWKEGEK